MPSFFETHHNQFDPWGTNASGKGMRNCQLGAYWAVWSHFTSTTKPALVSLPTGAGKTALMMALAFGLKASRVLIITPAATLRDQTAEKFRDLDDLKTAGAIAGTVPSPVVLSNAQQLGTRKAWLELQSADVVVATPKTTSPSEPRIYAPPKGIFDLLFIDEAHHAPAPTWAAILRAFGDVRCVLLTAT